MPVHDSKYSQATQQQDLSVVLVTGSYDHEIRFWEAWSGICSRTITRDEAGVCDSLVGALNECALTKPIIANKQAGSIPRVS